jgi:hypothetical protein
METSAAPGPVVGLTCLAALSCFPAGVNPRIQRAGVGRLMFDAFKDAVTEAGANMMLVDTQV